MTIKDIRKKNKLTQVEASRITGIPLRTYKMYENDESKIGSIKYNYIFEKLSEYGFIDESHGVLSLEEIQAGVSEVLSEYSVDYAILFGSYAKGLAVPTSDIDLLISTEISGMKFFGIAEKLRNKLNKRIDLLDLKQLNGNQDLLKNILGEGIRVYVQNKWIEHAIVMCSILCVLRSCFSPFLNIKVEFYLYKKTGSC